MQIYHGSPNKFNEFDYGRIRTNGTSEGIGFYFTDSKKIAQGYAQNGYIYTVELKTKKALSDNGLTLTVEEARKVIEAVDKEVGFLDNYGDVDYEGYAKVLKTAVDSEYYNSDTDTEFMGSLYNACGESEEVVKLFYNVLGYTHITSEPNWGNQELYIALSNDVIDIKKVEKV